MLRKFIYSEKAENLYFNSIKKSNTDTAILFLHGLVASRRSWGNLYNNLSKNASLYFVDLLGFGFSAKPNIVYTLDKHTAALHSLIEKEIQEKNIILVGHSLGTIVALGYLSLYPKRIKKIILLALPYYTSLEDAKKHISLASRFKFIFTYNLRTKILCTLMCSVFGSITRQISPFFLSDVPRAVAQDSHRHSYQSYISTLYEVIYKQNIPKLLNASPIDKIMLIHGTKDKIVPIKNVTDLAKKHNLSLFIKQDADHRFPIFHSNEILATLAKELS